MIKETKKVYDNNELYGSLNGIVSQWFRGKFKGFTESQKHSIIPIKGRKNILVSSPTGSGKTLCAFTSILDYLISLAERNELEDRIYAVYVSPLKSLSRDIEVNLKEPLKEMEERASKKLGIRVGVRTGDTSTQDRQKMLKNPPHILITTPETLAIVISTLKFVEHFRLVEFCIVDEIHALANKRGSHLSLSLERLQEISKIEFTRIGLSATIAPLEEMARFLVGSDRDCLIADVQYIKKVDMDVITPVSDLIETEAADLHSSLYDKLDELIEKHKTTLIFTNTRAATERVIHHLKDKFPAKYMENIGAHHSSLSKEHRYDIEERLRMGRLKVVVSSTSLELGIDIGYIDLVVLLGSPKSVARTLQRVGRAGHQLHETAKGRFIVLDRDDLVECSVIKREAVEKKIDRVQIPFNCLDVLSQHIYGMAIYKIWKQEEMFKLIKMAYPFNSLSKEDFLSVISYLSGEYSLEARNVYAKIWYDPERMEIGKRGKLARIIHMTNIGTIPEESFVNVVLARGEQTGAKVGVIDEGFLERMKKGDVFVLGGTRYEFLYTRGMNIYVRGNVQRPPTIPSWFSEMLPLNFDLALDIQRFRRLMKEALNKGKKEAINFAGEYLRCNKGTAEAIYNYFNEQEKYSGIPNDRLLLIERYNAEKTYIIFHTLYGRRVNDALSRAYAFAAAKIAHRDIEVGINDNGFFLAGDKIDVSRILTLVKPGNIEEILKEAIEKTEVLKKRFRHCAARSLMILRNYKGRKKSVGRQNFSSGFLMGTVRKVSREFPILKEARREVLGDLMDIDNARLVLEWIESGKIKIKQVTTKLPSPFALNLVMQGFSDLIKMEDRLSFLKRMHELHLKEIEERK
jgi:ATP-dependent helicase Lhr and Lhr-like helicase